MLLFVFVLLLSMNFGSCREVSYLYCSQCARAILNIQWEQLSCNQDQNKLQHEISKCHCCLQPLGFGKFGVLQKLMVAPWTDPRLTEIMSCEEEDEEGFT